MDQRRIVQEHIMNLTHAQRPEVVAILQNGKDGIQERFLSFCDLRPVLVADDLDRVRRFEERQLIPMLDDEPVGLFWISTYEFLTHNLVQALDALPIVLAKQR